MTGGWGTAGNPNLTEAKLDSFDVRLETFPRSGEVMAVSAFYKKINEPIEKVIGMKKLFSLCSLLLVALPLAAARPGGQSATGGPVPGAPWVSRANAGAVQVATAMKRAQSAVSAGVQPQVLLESNTYTFEPGEVMNLRVSVAPNGFTDAVTFYLYWQDRRTGEKRYYNIPSGGLLPAGRPADLFGAPGAPVPIAVPTWHDFVLFGSATDDAETTWATNGAIGASMTTPSSQTGLYQWVIEIRDASGTYVVSKSNAMFSYVESTVTAAGDLTANTTWTADKRYVLRDFVSVTNGAVLTIEPGTIIYGGNSQATLFITRGSKIMARGTNMAPIVFTSPHRVGDRAQRDWGGLLLFGYAPINEEGGEAVMEGLPTDPRYTFGGDDPHDSSGRLSYVRLEFGGFEIAVAQKINAFTPCGVGDSTQVDHIQVLFNKDDAVEPFGGTVLASAQSLSARLAGFSGGNADATGLAVLSISGTNISSTILTNGLDEPTAAHIHKVSDGSEFIDLGVAFSGASGSGSATADAAKIASLVAAPRPSSFRSTPAVSPPAPSRAPWPPPAARAAPRSCTSPSRPPSLVRAGPGGSPTSAWSTVPPVSPWLPWSTTPRARQGTRAQRQQPAPSP